mmetsp:Transcript_39605/g.95663  ORF Transcript_39605/g.95663 Transcript_39605/m.95663 type:complete len:247 (+) Transcript_39605:39-779(+)
MAMKSLANGVLLQNPYLLQLMRLPPRSWPSTTMLITRKNNAIWNATKKLFSTTTAARMPPLVMKVHHHCYNGFNRPMHHLQMSFMALKKFVVRCALFSKTALISIPLKRVTKGVAFSIIMMVMAQQEQEQPATSCFLHSIMLQFWRLGKWLVPVVLQSQKKFQQNFWAVAMHNSSKVIKHSAGPMGQTTCPTLWNQSLPPTRLMKWSYQYWTKTKIFPFAIPTWKVLAMAGGCKQLPLRSACIPHC